MHEYIFEGKRKIWPVTLLDPGEVSKLLVEVATANVLNDIWQRRCLSSYLWQRSMSQFPVGENT